MRIRFSNFSVTHVGRRRALPLWLFLLTVLCLLPAASFAAAPEIDRFFLEIQAASAQVQSFSSEFVQERRLALFAEPVIFLGKLTVVRPDRLRWEFTDPVPSALIFNGKEGMRCNDKAPPTHFDLGSDPIMRTVAEQLWLWLGGDYSKLSDKYNMASSDNSLIITPKEQATAEYIGAVTITFDAATKQPEQVLIAEPGGDSTLIRFKSYVLNGSIPDSLFSNCTAND
ncbi:MAG: outer-membrane lipoprotein carrier protein LolA [Pseudomonadota bacterium]